MSTVNPELRDELVDVFKKAWHHADEHGAGEGSRTRAGIDAVLATGLVAVVEEPPTAEFDQAGRHLVALSKWIDAGNAHRDAEAVTWGRLAKITEEAGEVIAAYIGATGQNPRKGQTHADQDVLNELLDVAVTALGAAEHLYGHPGDVLHALAAKISAVALRAGVTEQPEGGGRVAEKSETHRVSPGSSDHAGSRERLDPLAATDLTCSHCGGVGHTLGAHF